MALSVLSVNKLCSVLETEFAKSVVRMSLAFTEMFLLFSTFN